MNSFNKKIIIFAGIVLLTIFAVWQLNKSKDPNNITSAQDQNIYVLGSNNYGQLGNTDMPTDIEMTVGELELPGKVKQLDVGDKHSVALLEDGTVWAWGNNRFGQIGIGSEEIYITRPTQILELQNIEQISVKLNHNVALDKGGKVWTWGSNYSGQIGNGTNVNQNKPMIVDGLPRITKIGTGYRFSMALDEQGSIWAWGGSCSDENKQALTAALEKSATFELHGYHDPYGSDFDDREGISDCTNEDSMDINSKVPVKMPGFTNIVEFDAGYGHMVALDDQGRVWTDGCNQYGQLGFGMRGNPGNREPKILKDLPVVKQITAGFRQTIVIDENNDLWAWGYIPQEYSGEERHITSDMYDSVSRPNPTKVANLPNIKELIGAHDFSLYLMSDGSTSALGEVYKLSRNELSIVEGEPQDLTLVPNAIEDLATESKHIIAVGLTK